MPTLLHELDAYDRRIVELLRENARRTFGDIGRFVGLSAPAVKRRVDRLEARGVIRGYSAVVDWAVLGRPIEAFTELRFAGSTRVDDLESVALDLPEVHALFTVAGDPDALAWIRVRDVEDLKRVIDRLRASAKVTGTKTLIVLNSSVRTHSSLASGTVRAADDARVSSSSAPSRRRGTPPPSCSRGRPAAG